ncbi:ABC transporter substrate-binding protein [Methanothrix sp.]|uniref:ABC transporter substrate-binding protein n=1 Tax=Methanothrix sp. TaxID=90426 RepID=UPI003BB66CD1
MLNKFRLLGMAIMCIILVLAAASSSAIASELQVPGDRNGDHIVSEDELAAAKEDRKSGKISSDEFMQIELIHDKYPIEVTDSTGSEITVYKPLERIVVFNNQVSEVMQILNATDRIIGIAVSLKKDPLIAQAVKSLPDVGEVTEPDLEEVIKLDPDAVFDYSNTIFTKDETFKKLKASNPDLVIFRADLFRPESYVEEVEKLARILDKEDEAGDYIEFYQGVLSQIQEKTGSVPKEKRPRVYFEHSGEFGTAANGSGYHSDVVMAGGNNVFANLSAEYPTIDQETILQANPEVIIKLFGHGSSTSSGGYISDDTSEMEKSRKTIIDRPGGEDIDAVRNGRVYVLYSPLIDGARHIIGVSYLAKIFYPDLLADIGPEEIHQKYLDFVGFEYDLSEHKAFVIPEL